MGASIEKGGGLNAGVSSEQIDRAKQVDILDYLLMYEPDNLKRVGKAYYLKDHDSLEISNGLWRWHSTGIGGKNVVDYLIKVRGFSFVDAVRHLISDDVSIPPARPKCEPVSKIERPALIMPPRNKDNERLIAYLQGRGIAKTLILDCIKRGSLYESGDTWHNCVFIGRDDKGKARFASLRGTIGEFKRDVSGSDKRFAFLLPPINHISDTVAVFESPIDALSHQCLYPNSNLWRISLGGTALASLTNFLDRHKGISGCIICTDADEPGNIAAAKIAGIKGIQSKRMLPPKGKNDWNDVLMANIAQNKPSLANQLESAKEEAAELKKAKALNGVHKKNTVWERG